MCTHTILFGFVIIQFIPLSQSDAAKISEAADVRLIKRVAQQTAYVFVHVLRLKQLSERKQLLHPPVQYNWALTRP